MGVLESLTHSYPELLLAVGAMTLLIVGVFLGDKSAPKDLHRAGCIASRRDLRSLIFGPEASGVSLFDQAFRVDAFSSFAKVVIFGAAAFAILMSDRFLAGEKLGRFEYPVLILLAAFGMSLMVSATDLIALYMGLETQSLALYILAAFNRDSRRSTEAGLKYFVLGALASGLLLYGASLIYGFTGSTSFEEIARIAAVSENGNTRPCHWACVPDLRARVQGLRRAVPYVDPGRLRRRADAGDGVLRRRAEIRGDGADRAHACDVVSGPSFRTGSRLSR